MAGFYSSVGMKFNENEVPHLGISLDRLDKYLRTLMIKNLSSVVVVLY